VTPLRVAAEAWLNKEPFESEADFQQQLITAAKRMGYRCYHTHDSRKSEPGFPDLVLASPRQKRIVYAELKRPGENLSEDQAWWAAALLSAGEEWYLWRYADWDKALAVLARKEKA
jgi:hypothetical protein